MRALALIRGLLAAVIVMSLVALALYFSIDDLVENNNRHYSREAVEAVRSRLRTSSEQLKQLVAEWSERDEIVTLAKRNTRSLRRKLLEKNVFSEHQLAFVAILNSVRQLNFSRAFDAQSNKFSRLDEKLLYQLEKKETRSALGSEILSGYLLSAELYQVAVSPVYAEGRSGDAEGYLIVGRKIAKDELNTVAHNALQYMPVNLALNPGQARELQAFELQPVVYQRNRTQVKTSILLQDIAKKPVIVISLVRSHQPVDILLKLSWPSLLVLTLVALLIGFVFWRRKRKALQKDINRLVNDIQTINVGTELSGRISSENRHIFTDIVNAINQKIGGFEQSIDHIHLHGRRHDAEIVLNELPLEAYLKDTDLRYITVNQRYCDSLGMVREEIIGKTDAELAEIVAVSQIEEQERNAIATREPLAFEEVIENEQRGKTFYSTSLIPFINDKGRVEGVVGVKIDITNHRRAEAEMEMASKVLENTAEGVMVTDADCRIIHVNTAYTEVTGYSESELLGKIPLLLQKESKSRLYQDVQKSLDEHGIWSGELWSSRKDGTSYPEMINIKVIRNKDGEITNYFSMSNDITEQKKWEQQLYKMAHYDALTGLPNRTLFKDRLRQEIIRAQRNNKHCGVLFLDLDLFKSINDSLGHAAGDELLKVVSERLQATLRNADSIARMGGDEFTILVTDLVSDYNKNISYLTRLCEKIIDVIKQPIDINGREISATCSVGVTVFPVDADNVEDLLRNADSAMYYAKSQGRRNYQFYSREFNEKAVERLEKEIEFRTALKDGALQIYYQPQIDVISRHVVGAEALLRWKKDGETILGPDKIVALAEETGLIYELGNWILKRACIDCKQWRDQGHKNMRVAVNLSTRQFRQKDLVEIVSGILEETSLPGKLLELEVTESALMENIDYSIEMMADLSRIGIRWSLDDFGTGYSSLTYLRDFPVHVLKVDQSFVREITINPEDSAIVETIIDLAHRLHLTVIAEGVENEEQLKVLSRMNCEQVQGYYFSQPMPQQSFLEYVNQGVKA